MAKKTYSSKNRRLILELEFDKATFVAAVPTVTAAGRTRSVILDLKKHVGDSVTSLAVRMTHREALKMLVAVSGCIVHEGTEKCSGEAAAILGSAASGSVKRTQAATRGQPKDERLLDDRAFQVPEQTVAGLTPVESLRLLEDAEPRLAAFVERRMAAVLAPLRAAAVDEAVVQKVHREAVGALVASLLTLGRGYRDLYSDLLPCHPAADGLDRAQEG